MLCVLHDQLLVVFFAVFQAVPASGVFYQGIHCCLDDFDDLCKTLARVIQTAHGAESLDLACSGKHGISRYTMRQSLEAGRIRQAIQIARGA